MHEVRVAGYQGELRDISADYTLDAVMDFYGRIPRISKANMERYQGEVAIFNPDLIISDLDLITSTLATRLGIPYWIVSSFALYVAIQGLDAAKLNLGKYHKTTLDKDFDHFHYNEQLEEAEKVFVYSYLGDLKNSPALKNNCYYVRPYFQQTDSVSPKKLLIAMGRTKKDFLQYAEGLNDTVVYSQNAHETLRVPHLSFDNHSYTKDVSNCYVSFNSGHTSLVADAIYNGKQSLVYADYEDKDCVLNQRLVECYGVGERLYSRTSYDQLNDLAEKRIANALSPNRSVLFLDELLREI